MADVVVRVGLRTPAESAAGGPAELRQIDAVLIILYLLRRAPPLRLMGSTPSAAWSCPRVGRVPTVTIIIILYMRATGGES